MPIAHLTRDRHQAIVVACARGSPSLSLPLLRVPAAALVFAALAAAKSPSFALLSSVAIADKRPLGWCRQRPICHLKAPAKRPALSSCDGSDVHFVGVAFDRTSPKTRR